MGYCFDRKKEEENEINNSDEEKSDSLPEIQNTFNPEEYENVILAEKK